MYAGKTLFAQLMDFLPWSTFDRLVTRYRGDHRVRTLTCAEQYRAMAFAQLTWRESLRDIETCLAAQSGKLYHMGFREPVRRSTLADAVVVLNHSLVTDSTIGSGASVGPCAHLRGHAQVAPRARVGNFVELKKTVLGENSKASHLTYLGDAIIGADVNIGAGTITCNYDGATKQVTTIADGAFIGSDTQLIAPVTVGERAYVGTGTTVREDVPPGALAVSAGKQRNIDGWVARKRKRNTGR